MDAVYPIGRGSRWSDNELRYSLRSLAKFAPEVDRIIIVGHRPEFIGGTGEVVHLPVADVWPERPCANVLLKLEAALSEVRGQEFVWMNDDIYLLAEQDWSEVHHSPVPKHRTPYYQHCYLEARSYLFGIRVHPCRDHELHVPVKLNGAFAFEVLQGLPHFDMAFRTVYFNLWCSSSGIESAPMLDHKLHSVRNVGSWASFSSSSAMARNLEFRKMVQRLYPDPSPWERT